MDIDMPGTPTATNIKQNTKYLEKFMRQATKHNIGNVVCKEALLKRFPYPMNAARKNIL